MDLSKIEEYAKKRKRSMSSVARACGKSPSGLKQSIQRDAVPAVDIEQIILFLEIPIGEIFDNLPIPSIADEPLEDYNSKKPKYLEQRLLEVERDLHRLKSQLIGKK